MHDLMCLDRLAVQCHFGHICREGRNSVLFGFFFFFGEPLLALHVNLLLSEGGSAKRNVNSNKHTVSVSIMEFES